MNNFLLNYITLTSLNRAHPADSDLHVVDMEMRFFRGPRLGILAHGLFITSVIVISLEHTND